MEAFTAEYGHPKAFLTSLITGFFSGAASQVKKKSIYISISKLGKS